MSGRVSTNCWMKACTLHGMERERVRENVVSADEYKHEHTSMHLE